MGIPNPVDKVMSGALAGAGAYGISQTIAPDTFEEDLLKTQVSHNTVQKYMTDISVNRNLLGAKMEMNSLESKFKMLKETLHLRMEDFHNVLEKFIDNTLEKVNTKRRLLSNK